MVNITRGTGGIRLRSMWQPRTLRWMELVLGAALLLAVSSCATVPKTAVPTGSALAALLPGDSALYASIKVAQNRALISSVLAGSGIEKSIPPSISDQTSLLMASVQISSDGKPLVSMVASGSFPVGMIGWKLNWSRDWQRNGSSIRWWQDKKNGVQIAAPNRNLVLVSTGELPSMLKNYAAAPENPLSPTVRQAFDSSDLSIYVPKLTDSLPFLGMDTKRFPIDSFYFAITAERSSLGNGQAGNEAASSQTTAGTPQYHGFAVFRMKSERDARLFSVVFKLLIASSESGSAIGGFPIPLKGAQLTVDSSTIRLSGISVSEKDLSDLIGTVIGGKQRAATQ